VSVAPAWCCAFAFGTWLPHDHQRYVDYRAARPCAARAAAHVGADCLSTQHFTVVKTVVKDGKSSEYRAYLRDDGSWRGEVDFGGWAPLLNALEPGDPVTATVWRHRIMALSKDGVRQKTSDEPRDELQMNAAIGLLAGLVAGWAFVFGAVHLVVPRCPGPFAWKAYGRRMLWTVIAAPWVVGLPAVWLGVPWGFVPPVVLAMVCGAVVMCLRGWRSAVRGR
jgi:hypothetical protein